MDNPADDEAPIDPGFKHKIYTEQDFEGHRAHTVFVGVHVPFNRRHSHRRHKHHTRENGDRTANDLDRPRPNPPLMMTRRRVSINTDDGEILTPPAQRVQFILGEDTTDPNHESHPLFSEMEELVQEGDEVEWKETARWVKFEEDVERGGNRWSKPHVATLSLHSLFELRSLLLNGTLMLDMEATSLEQVAELVSENMVNAGALPIEARDKVIEALLRRHRHQHQQDSRKKDNSSRLPIIRSLTEIGKNQSASKNTKAPTASPSINRNSSRNSLHAELSSSRELLDEIVPSPESSLLMSPCGGNDQRGHYLAVPTGNISPTPSSSGDIGVTTWFHAGVSGSGCSSNANPVTARVDDQQRNSTNATANNLNKTGNGNGKNLSIPGSKLNNFGIPSTGDSIVKSMSNASMQRNASGNELNNGEQQYQKNTQFMRKIPPGAEASNILVGEVDFLEKTLVAFIRLTSAVVMGDLTEVPVPTRFIFILLGPPGSHSSFHEIGRSMATLMSDEIFHEVAYRARKRDHLLAGIDEFLDAVTVLPPGEWDPAIRIEPPAAIPSQEVRKRPPEKNPKEEIDEEEEEQKQREESGLARTGKLFGGLVNDLKRKTPFYFSDFKDALNLKCIASWIFLYFACLSPIITFGGLLGEATGKNMAAMESLVSGFLCGLGYGFFSGQPLTILGSTGPVLVFETIVYDFCQMAEWDYMTFRFWIGTWVSVILIILVAVDASALVCYITRFTEENFATLIAFIFIYKAVENVLSIGKKFPLNRSDGPYSCYCLPPGNESHSTEIIHEWSHYDKTTCLRLNGTRTGIDCDIPEYVSDVFLMSIILFLGTFIISVILKDFKNALFFPAKVRQLVSDFSVIIAIFSMTILDYLTNIKTPKLEVPHEFKPTLPDRGWIISPYHEKNPLWSNIAAVLPALLGTILIFMDQQITAVIVNRKENKLKKGCGYHLDLFVLAILIQLCTIMGLPWFVAATVLSINHVNSLKLESETAAPGEKPQFLGVLEQRVTHILIFTMIGCSVFLTPLLKHIPMPVLFGVFLYMGAASLKGLQFFDRLLIMLMPVKYQPDYMYLRQVPIRRVHLFTLIQLACLIALWSIKSFTATSILFPLMLVVMIGIRKSLDCIFTRREMKILDDVMPELSRRNKDDLHHLDDAEDHGNNGYNQNVLNRTASTAATTATATQDNGINKNASINISEEVNRTAIWKQVNDNNKSNKTEIADKKSMKNALSSDKKRLSTMNEESEKDAADNKRQSTQNISQKFKNNLIKEYWTESKVFKSVGDEEACETKV